MTDAPAPARDLAEHAPKPFLWVLGAALGAAALGASAFLSPALPFVLAGAFGFLILCFAAPAWAAAAFAFAHLAVPVYLRPPAIGPLPPPPVAISMLLVLAGALSLGVMVGARERLPWGGAGRTAFALFLVFAAVAAASLADPRTTSEGVNMWVKAFGFTLVALLVVSASIRDARAVELTLRALLGASVVISLYAIHEFTVGRNWLLETYLIPTGEEDWSKFYFTGDVLGPGVAYRSFSMFSQPIEFATCVGMIFPFAVVRFGTARGALERLVYAGAAAICLIGLATSFSRTATAAAIAAAVVAGLLVPQLRRWLLAGVVAGGVALLLAWPMLSEKVSERINDTDNITLRGKLWETALAIFADHPILGVGFGNFPEYYLEAMREHMIGPVTEFGAASVERIRVAESFYLQLAAETGLIGLAAFGLFLIACAALLLRLMRARDREIRLLGTAIALGAAVYLMNAATVTAYTHFSSTMLLFGLLFPLAIALERRIAATKPLPESA